MTGECYMNFGPTCLQRSESILSNILNVLITEKRHNSMKLASSSTFFRISQEEFLSYLPP